MQFNKLAVSLFQNNQTSNNPQNSQSFLRNKKQNFKKEIRKQFLDEYRAKIRKNLVFKDKVDYNLLSNIDLNQVMNTLAKYKFPQRYKQGVQIEIDLCNQICDLQDKQNSILKKSIQDIFLYATSSVKDHFYNYLDQIHIGRLIDIMSKKLSLMRPYVNQKSYAQHKKIDYLVLPLIYERVLVIMAECSFNSIAFYQQNREFLIEVLNEILYMFPIQTRVVQCSVEILASLLQDKLIVESLLKRQNSQNEQNCILTRILNIFSYNVKNFSPNTNHSRTVRTSCINFYGRLFLNSKIHQIPQKMRQKLFSIFYKILTHPQSNQEILVELSSTLLTLYDQNIRQFPQLLLQTQGIFQQIIEGLNQLTKNLNNNKITQILPITKKLYVFYYSILISIYEHAGDQFFTGNGQWINDGMKQIKFTQIAELLDQYLRQKVDLLLLNGINSRQNGIVCYTLQLIKVICNWGDLILQIYQNKTLIARMFAYAKHQNISIRNQAIQCICNIVQGFLVDKNCREEQQMQIYQLFIEKFDFLDILVQNLDKHTDFLVNRQILTSIKTLCYFFKSDPQLQKANKFWMKFVQNGGQLKLNAIVGEQRNSQLQSIALEILNNFANGRQIEI